MARELTSLNDIPDRKSREPVTATRTERLDRAFRAEEFAGFRFAIQVRSVALVLIGAWLTVYIPWPRITYYLAFVVLFLITGLVAERLRSRSRFPTSWTALFILIDACLLTYVLIAPNPFDDVGWPIQVTLRFHNHLYLFLMLMISAFSYSPVLVLWSGVSLATAWSAGVFYIRSLPDSVTGDLAGTKPDETLASYLQPFYIADVSWWNQVVLLLIAALIIAAAVWRARRLVRQQVATEEARVNLARYFSPNIVERLSDAPEDLGTARAQPVAILFVDVVGFTKLSEDLAPDVMISEVRDFHSRMVERVFEFDGTVDKFMGDSVMATFGTPSPGTADATNALRCALAILEEVADWNRARDRRGLEPVKVGIGVHYGNVVAGNVGADRRLEFTVMGDPVNVASRLERLTRDHETPIVVSDELVECVRGEAAGGQDLLGPFADLGEVSIRGRRGSVRAWRYGVGDK